jgi:hypothetical protein
MGKRDFLSLDPSSLDEPRLTDGSLPPLGFLHPSKGSGLSAHGIDVGLPGNGSAPDLGGVRTEVAAEHAPGRHVPSSVAARHSTRCKGWWRSYSAGQRSERVDGGASIVRRHGRERRGRERVAP